MIKLTSNLVLLIHIICLFSMGLVAQKDSNKTSQSMPHLEVNLDKKTVLKACPDYYASKQDKCPKDKQNIKLSVIPKGVEDNDLTYTYIISGGRVIGSGNNVVLDFTGNRPGLYSILVKATDNKNLNIESEKITVAVESCADCFVCGLTCRCPVIEAKSLTLSVKAGETITFNATVIGGTQQSITYNWTISLGKIIEGQSTPIIKVKTDSTMIGETILATIEISGLCADCGKTANVIVKVEKP